MSSVDEFIAMAAVAAANITPGKVDWGQSPWGWMRHHSPRTKRDMGKDLVRCWLDRRGIPYAEPAKGEGDHHFTIAGKRVVAYFGILGKDGDKIEYSQLRSPGRGADSLLLIGIEPRRVRIWALHPRDVQGMKTYKEQVPGLHSFTFDPEDVPEILIERECWEDGDDGGQDTLFAAPWRDDR